MDTGRIKLEEFQIVPDHVSTVSSKKKKKKGKGMTEVGGTKEKCDSAIEIIQMDDINLEIDFIGYPISLVNSYRRIILAEVATMAIEKVYMYNNTSIVQDEVLAHRLGLVPLKIDPRYFEFISTDDETRWGAQDSVTFELKVKCSKNPSVKSGEVDPNVLYKHRTVYSSSLKWKPIDNQADIFATPLTPLDDDVILAKMNPGHEICLDVRAVKGIGSDHAKFQPGLSWYRMLPEVELLREVKGEDAHLLQRCFSPGVIQLDNKDGEVIASVGDPRYDACSRNVFQYDSIKDAVKLSRKTDHIIFYVESHSALKSYEILEEAVGIVSTKCDNLLLELDKYLASEDSK